MIVLESWERARFEEELLYYTKFYQQSGDTIPLVHELIIKRMGKHLVTLCFLLVQSPFGLAYESLERVAFRPEAALVKFAPDPEPVPEVWRILL
jgi:hypothetical protein